MSYQITHTRINHSYIRQWAKNAHKKPHVKHAIARKKTKFFGGSIFFHFLFCFLCVSISTLHPIKLLSSLKKYTLKILLLCRGEHPVTLTAPHTSFVPLLDLNICAVGIYCNLIKGLSGLFNSLRSLGVNFAKISDRNGWYKKVHVCLSICLSMSVARVCCVGFVELTVENGWFSNWQ